MSTDPNPNPDPQPTGDEPKFTQAQVDEMIQAEVSRVVKKKAEDLYRRRVGDVDIDDLKTKAAGATTLEERVAEIERQARESEERAMRAEIANAKGLTPSQAKRLVGSTREELEADADELLADIGAQKKQGNHVPREGATPSEPKADEMRDFTRSLFGSGD